MSGRIGGLTGGRMPVTTIQAQMATAEATRQTHARIEAVLGAELKSFVGGDTLQASMELISELHGLTIVTDRPAFNDVGLDGLDGLQVHEALSLQRIRVANALDLILSQTDSEVPLDYIIENEVLKITTREVAEMHRETRVYDLGGMTTADVAADSLLEVMRKSVNFDEHPDVDSQLIGDRLVVRHNRRAHRVIADLLSQFKVPVGGSKPAARR